MVFAWPRRIIPASHLPEGGIAVQSWHRAGREQRGLIALELVVAVALLAVSSAAARVRPATYVDRAELAAVQSAAVQIQQALETWAVYNGGAYPTTGEIQDYAGLEQALGAYVTLPDAAKAPFELVSYTGTGGSYTLVIRGRDAAQTTFTITPAGVTREP